MNKTIATVLCCLALGACDTGTAIPAPVDEDQDGYAVEMDCDDTNAAVHPGASETCNAIDDDCDGTTDVGLMHTLYADADADGFGAHASPMTSCASAVAGYVADDTDCDDTAEATHPGAAETCTDTSDLNCDGSFGDADVDGDGVIACLDCNDAVSAIHPGATEVCDAASTDEDCDGTADDADASATGKSAFHVDADGDGYGFGAAVSYCHAPLGYVVDATDCDDGADEVHPGATEVCDAVSTDEDCDGTADDADASATGKSVYYADGDEDGFGGSASASFCAPPAGYLATSTDCDDGASAVHPGATEVCDATSTDEDCDGAADDADPSVTGRIAYRYDGDSDGYGGTTSASFCQAPAGYVLDTTDCSDGIDTIHPGATELCDGIDQNCDGTIDFGFTVPTTHATIQSAVDAASTGDHVCVLAGTYTSAFTVRSKNITLEGQDRDTVILDAKLVGQIATLRDTATVMKNFTLTNTSTGGQILALFGGGTPTVENVDIHGVSQTSPGYCSGVVMIDGASPTLRDVSIHDNTFACDVASSGVITINNGLLTTTLERVSVVDNTTTVGAKYRGAIFLYKASIDATNLIVANNHVDATAAAAVFYSFGIGSEAEADVSLVNSAIVGNTAGANMSPAYTVAWSNFGVTYVRNLVVASNTSAGQSAFRFANIQATSDVAYIDAFDNDPTSNADWGAYGDPATVTGLMSVDPLFVDTTGASASTWDLDLAPASLLIDAGDPGILDLDATRSDIGAYGGPLASW